VSRLLLAWHLARPELRGGLRGFAVFFACLTLGVAAIATVGVLNAGLIEGLRRDASALLGGDVAIDASNLPLPAAELAALTPPGAKRSAHVRTNAMAQSADGRRVVVSLKAVDAAYPLYGSVRLDPASLSLDRALADQGVVVERSLLARLGLEVGDRLRIGKADFVIRAVLEREPDRIGGYVTIGPRAMVGLDQLAGTGTILPGSLAEYDYGLALPKGIDANAYLARIRAEHPDARWRARGTRDVQPQITRFTDRLATYLTLAGLTALLIGGVGVALAIQNYLAGKTTTIATLKCLGASSGLVFRIYLLQILVLAGLGSLLGLAIGQAAPWFLRALVAPLLPIRIGSGWYPLPLLIALGAGLLTALVFAIWPLARARAVSPAGMFRALIAPPARWPPLPILALLGLGIVGLAGLALAGVADRRIGLIFIGTALAAAILLAGLATLILRGVRLLGRRGGARTRIALANLHRPGAGAASVIIALGAGLAVLTMVALIDRNLAAEIDLRLPKRAPSLFFIDLQPDQRRAFEALIAKTDGAELMQIAPIVRSRVVRINGVPVDQTGIMHWTLRHDRGLSYVGARPEGTELVAGSWWPDDYTGPPLVSVEDEVAAAYGVGVGDTLAFNVLGRVIEARIVNLRAEIDWSQARLNFVFLLSPGVLEAAPHTLAATVDVPPAAEAGLLDRLAGQLPNVTPISVRAMVAQVDEVMRKIKLAVAAVAGVTLLSGVLVLAGAVAAARRRHLYEAVVLKVLGARRLDLLRIFLLEYLGLGATAALAGGLLGSLGAAAVVIFAMHLPWTFSLPSVLAVLVLALGLTLTAGFLGTWRLLGRPAAPVLRSP
jgi:putative ABC transport system permease protein